MKISFIGLGIMGSRMAANLLQAGYSLVIYNRTPDRAAALLEAGAAWAESPAIAGAQAEILITMLAHPEAVEESALGSRGFLAHLKPGSLWIDCSTVNPSFTRRMAAEAQARGIALLDAPVAGSRLPAEQGTLTFFVGGEAEALARCQPLLDAMGRRTVHVGDQGMGTSLKMVSNMILASNMAVFAEGLALGRSLGMELDFLFDELLATPVVPPYMAVKREKIESGVYDADFPLKWMRKDLHLASGTAYEANVALPLANTAKELYGLAAASGLAEEDFAAIFAFLERGGFDAA